MIAEILASGRQKLGAGDSAGALEDFTRGLEGNDAGWADYCRYGRGQMRRLQGDPAGAAEDFRAILPRLSATTNPRRNDCAFWLFLTECERGQAEAAGRELEALVLDKTAPQGGDWDRLLAGLLLGRSTEEQLLSQVATAAPAATNARRFQALLYSAMLHRQKGDTAGALELFRQAGDIPIAQFIFEFERTVVRRALQPRPP
jgi:hypothetical protein